MMFRKYLGFRNIKELIARYIIKEGLVGFDDWGDTGIRRMNSRWVLKLNYVIKIKKGELNWFGKEGDEFVFWLIEFTVGYSR